MTHGSTSTGAVCCRKFLLFPLSYLLSNEGPATVCTPLIRPGPALAVKTSRARYPAGSVSPLVNADTAGGSRAGAETHDLSSSAEKDYTRGDWWWCYTLHSWCNPPQTLATPHTPAPAVVKRGDIKISGSFL